MKYHPDKVKDEADRENAEEKFKELAACYQILSDKDQRRKYDASGYNEQFDSAGGGAQYSNFDGRGFEDIFSSFFGAGNQFGFDDMFGGGGGGGGFQFNVGGNDFGHGGFGGQRQHQPQQQKSRRSAEKKAKKVFVDLKDLMDDHFVDVDHVQLEIPKGFPDGKVINERGKKFAVYSRDDDVFSRKRSDLYMKRSISLEDALLGFELKVQSIDGEMIEERMDHFPVSKMYKIKGKGLPRFEGKTRGHLFVEFIVEMPQLTKKQQDELKEYLKNQEWDYTAAKKETNKQNKRKSRSHRKKEL